MDHTTVLGVDGIILLSWLGGLEDGLDYFVFVKCHRKYSISFLLYIILCWGEISILFTFSLLILAKYLICANLREICLYSYIFSANIFNMQQTNMLSKRLC